MSEQRQAFEDWANEQGLWMDRDGDSYFWDKTRAAWEKWQLDNKEEK